MNNPHRTDITVRHLQAFVAACDEHHVGRAATRLNLTQPAVSKTLSDLERIVGLKLLERGRRGTRPTPRGQAFLVQARKAVEAVSAARNAVSEHTRSQSVVRLGVLPTVAPALVPNVVTTFQQTHAGVGLVIVTRTNAELLELLHKGDIDVAVGRMSEPAATAGLTFELLYLDSLSLAMRKDHPLARTRPLTLAQALAFPLVICNAGSAPHRNTEALFGMHGSRLPTNCVETLDVATASRIVRESDAIWIAPTSTLRAIDGLTTVAVSAPGHTATEAVGLFRRLAVPAAPETEALARCLRVSAGSLHTS